MESFTEVVGLKNREKVLTTHIEVMRKERKGSAHCSNKD